MKNVKGFTLIELIVVIAIIGILAAILIPTMIGYMGDSHLSVANANAKTLYTNAAAYATSCSAKGYTVSTSVDRQPLQWESSSMPDFEYCEDGADILNSLKAAMGSEDPSAGYATVKMQSSGMPLETMWAKTLSDKYVGHYPTEYTEKTEDGLPSAQ